ncbi:MAG: Uma2 family endonuclease [Dehalococcoidia bacterium]
MSVRRQTQVSEGEYLATMTGVKPSLEFVNGKVIQKPLTKRSHAEVSKRLAAIFFAYERSNGGYFAWETTTNLSEGPDRRYRVPDLAYWAPGKPVGDEIFLPPTLAIEVVSEGQTLKDMRDKCAEYLSRGVEVCWLIDPRRRIAEILSAGAAPISVRSGAVLVAPPFPGLAVPFDDLFA